MLVDIVAVQFWKILHSRVKKQWDLPESSSYCGKISSLTNTLHKHMCHLLRTEIKIFYIKQFCKEEEEEILPRQSAGWFPFQALVSRIFKSSPHGCKLQMIGQTFSKTFPTSNCHGHIWIQHEKCIQMSTNKPSIGAVVLEIASWILRKYLSSNKISEAETLAWCSINSKVQSTSVTIYSCI